MVWFRRESGQIFELARSGRRQSRKSDVMPMRDDHPNPFWGPPDPPKRGWWPWALALLICTGVAVAASRFL